MTLRFVWWVAVFGVIALLSRVPLTAPSEGAMVQLAWRHLGERAQVRLSPQELEKLPVHMRPQEGVTETRFVPYRLTVNLDERTALERLVTPGGLHGDRPLVVFERLPASPGPVRVRIDFSPEGGGEGFRLDRTFELEPGQVLLIRLGEGGFTAD